MSEGFEENVHFLELNYLDPELIELDTAFSSIAPLLWLRAGARGQIVDECLDVAGRRKPYIWTDYYGVLFNPDRWRSFVEKSRDVASAAFIVTDSQTTFAGIASELPGNMDVVRLYENYLSTFAINRGYL
jgi:adenine-specific DNA-methyltransferase